MPWLWPRPAAAAPIQPLAWERPYATGAAVKKKKYYYCYNVKLFGKTQPSTIWMKTVTGREEFVRTVIADSN